MRFILMIIILCFHNLYSQEKCEEKHQFENLYGKRVFINKTVIAYTYIISKNKGKGKTYSNINIPFYIIIETNNSSCNIRIHSKTMTEDISIDFECVHRRNAYYGTEYEFNNNYNNLKATYTIPNDGSHQTLSLSQKNEFGNEINSYFFIISKYNQL